jgi:hypothetical protein
VIDFLVGKIAGKKMHLDKEGLSRLNNQHFSEDGKIA